MTHFPASSHCYLGGESNGFAQLRCGSQGSERQRPRAKQQDGRSHASEGLAFPGSSYSCVDNQVTLKHASGSLSHLSESLGAGCILNVLRLKTVLFLREAGPWVLRPLLLSYTKISKAYSKVVWGPGGIRGTLLSCRKLGALD